MAVSKLFFLLILLKYSEADLFCTKISSSKPNIVDFTAGAITDVIKALRRIHVPDIIKKIAPENVQSLISNGTNENIDLNISQLITKYNYTVEEHNVTTTDGYILKMFRIPSKGKPVLVMHGQQGSSDDWVTTGPKSGLGYLLADKGYDVWLGNNRGNKHSRQHVFYSPDCAEYWDFSWDEMGRYDLPAMIDHILDITNNTKLSYVGHSQGTTGYFVLASEKPEYNEKISIMIALPALAYVEYIVNPFLQIFGEYSDVIYEFCKKNGIYAILGDDPLSEFYQTTFCSKPIDAALKCFIPLFPIAGYDFAQINYDQLPVITNHYKAGSSIKQYIHYGQGVKSGKFRQFDYGAVVNLLKYKNVEPLDYPLKKITSPIVIFYSYNDFISDINDLRTLESQLPNIVERYHVPWLEFNNLDYLFAKDVKLFVNDKVIDVLGKYA